MYMDAIDLRDFYATSLGQAARRVLRHRIRALWPDVAGQNVLGLGFATPFLSPFRGEAARVLAAMPASQGVLPWPREEGGLTTLVDEVDLPFPDMSMDRILIVHGLECTEQQRPFMREVWRVLASSGRLLVVAPNRRGIWARLERTPFGNGLPYSTGQLSRVLRDTLFTPDRAHGALFVPPTRWRLVLSAAMAWEEVGPRWFGTFGGVVMAEATKQIYAGTAEPARRRRTYAALASRDTGL
jgi:SAM-dependent methyltransferase